MPSLSLVVGGRAYGGWQTMRVTRSIESIAGSFELGVTEKWFAQEEAWPITEGDPCAIMIGGETVLTGYIDERRLSFGPGQHSVSVSGRDKAGDLVDCSAILDKKWQTKNISILKFVEKICAHYDVKVSVQPGLGAPPIASVLTVSPGDTAFNAIEHACRAVGVLVVSDGRGGIVLTRPGKLVCGTTLKQGDNVLRADSAFKFSDRFRTYRVLAQSKGTDDQYGESVSKVVGTALDLGISRTARELIIRPEKGMTREQAKTRAQWEATTRAAKSQTVTAVVQGWTQASGELWPVNQLVKVELPALGVNTTLLIAQVTYAFSANEGSTTTLELRAADSYVPVPALLKGGGPGGNNLWPEIAKGV